MAVKKRKAKKKAPKKLSRPLGSQGAPGKAILNRRRQLCNASGGKWNPATNKCV